MKHLIEKHIDYMDKVVRWLFNAYFVVTSGLARDPADLDEEVTAPAGVVIVNLSDLFPEDEADPEPELSDDDRRNMTLYLNARWN